MSKPNKDMADTLRFLYSTQIKTVKTTLKFIEVSSEGKVGLATIPSGKYENVAFAAVDRGELAILKLVLGDDPAMPLSETLRINFSEFSDELIKSAKEAPSTFLFGNEILNYLTDKANGLQTTSISSSNIFSKEPVKRERDNNNNTPEETSNDTPVKKPKPGLK